MGLQQGLRATCVRLEVTGGAQALQSEPLPTAGKAQLLVGVARGELPWTVRLRARGYGAPDCADGTATGEASAELDATFASPAAQVDLELGPLPPDGGTGGGAGADGDGDGVPTPADCDDLDPQVHPGAAEICSDGKDNDCAAGADCDDPVCAGQACRAGDVARCAGTRCAETACGNAADDDGDLLIDCADPDCAARACSAQGTCASGVCVAPNEVGLCFDGVDNDGDLLVDCADPDCPAGAACSDLDACTLTDTCGAPDGGCQAGGPKACTAPPQPQCFASSGVCLPDAGGACSYAVVAGTCDDGRACTTGDTCAADGGCGGTLRACDTPPGPQCWQASGTCSEGLGGLCVYAPLGTGAACSDGDDCTDGDACAGDGGCAAGVPRTCAPPGECWAHDGTCFTDGGCGFSARTSQACGDGGTCNSSGACVVPSVFPYTPSNFTEALLPASAGTVHFGCGLTTLSTGLADGGVAWTNNCAGNATPAYALVPVGSLTAMLVFVDALGIDAGSTLRVVGSRPLILAVRGNASIRGTLDVGSSKTLPGAGANLDCAEGQGDAGTASGSPETAGGGGGAAFGANGGNGSNGANGGPRGTRGAAFGLDTLVPLHGGCRGGNGGRVGDPWGQGGNGGGALQVSVGGALNVAGTGTITAYGAGGRGGQEDQRTGGGGAGSGGGLLLEGETVTVATSGAVTANGGSGGEGSGYGSGWYGQDGVDGLPRAITSALTPTVGACGGNGGAGGSRSSGATSAGAPECGTNMPGGGGGGGVGRIRINGNTSCTLTGATISPQASGNRTGCF